MFCSNCGEELYDPNQKFCQGCGFEIVITNETPRLKVEQNQYEPIDKSRYLANKQQKTVLMGMPGEYSKKCLGFALASLVTGIFTLVLGYNLFMYSYYPYYYSAGRIVILIVILLLRVGGLIFGIFSRINSVKAENLESLNSYERVGSVFAVFGIILNSVGLLLSFLGPWSLIRYIMPFGIM
jgi:hypothetical protein